MRVGRAFASVVVVTGVWSAAADAASEDSPEGYWLTKGYLVEISRCGEAFCGRLAGLKQTRRPERARLDSRNRDPGKRRRPLCGIDLFGGFRAAGREAGKWEGGWIYNPDDGNTYSSIARLESPDRLKVRGYVAIPAIGRDLTLVRAGNPDRRCSP
jgi:uncharacterized protein (DUF2147 family)